MEGDIISLLPIVMLFVMIFTTKRMLLSVTAASLVGAIVLGGWNFASVWLEKIQAAFMGGTVGYLLLLLVLFGILIGLLDKSGAAIEFANWLSRFANTRKKAMLLTFLLGWVIFVDDYLNNMAVSTAMKKVCDKHRIPRTLFGFLVNCTAAPVCVLIPFSTWAAFYGSLFEQYDITVNGSGLSAYITGIPYLFYAWVLLIICLLVILGVFPLVGVTRKDNKLAIETGVVCSAEESENGHEIRADDADMNDVSTKGSNPFVFIIPLVVIIILTIITEQVMVGCMAAIAATVAIILIQKKMRITEIFDSAFEGVTGMAAICALIVVALGLVEINTATGMPAYVVRVITPLLSGKFFPALVFIFCGAYSLFIGGLWDSSMIFMPIVVPVALALNMDPLLPCMALVCAATLGSTTYVASDAVLITSRAVDLKTYYQMLGTLPYSLISYGISTIAFLVAGIIIA